MLLLYNYIVLWKVILCLYTDVIYIVISNFILFIYICVEGLD